MFKVKIYIIDTIIELKCNSKAVIGVAINGFKILEVLSCNRFLVELYAVYIEGNETLIGEYNSITEFLEVFEIIPPAESYALNDQTSK